MLNFGTRERPDLSLCTIISSIQIIRCFQATCCFCSIGSNGTFTCAPTYMNEHSNWANIKYPELSCSRTQAVSCCLQQVILVKKKESMWLSSANGLCTEGLDGSDGCAFGTDGLHWDRWLGSLGWLGCLCDAMKLQKPSIWGRSIKSSSNNFQGTALNSVDSFPRRIENLVPTKLHTKKLSVRVLKLHEEPSYYNDEHWFGHSTLTDGVGLNTTLCSNCWEHLASSWI